MIEKYDIIYKGLRSESNKEVDFMRIGGISLNTYQHYSSTNNELGKTIEKLSTGLKINEAADDPAGMAVAEKMRAQIRGSKQAFLNAQYGISMINVAENALSETTSILQRMRELAVQAASDVLSDTDRTYVGLEIEELKEEIERIGDVTEYNKRKILGKSFTFQVGANEGDELKINFMDINPGIIPGEVSVATRKESSVLLSDIDNAIDFVSMNRVQIGGNKEQLGRVCDTLSTYITNLSAAEENITGADMMKEVMNFTKLKITSDVKAAIMSQANQIPGVIYSVLRDSM